MAVSRYPFNKFMITGAPEYASYEDASPVVYGAVGVALCLEPRCAWIKDIPVEWTLADVLDECENHWNLRHALLGRDV
jgi:hypothetical protein